MAPDRYGDRGFLPCTSSHSSGSRSCGLSAYCAITWARWRTASSPRSFSGARYSISRCFFLSAATIGSIVLVAALDPNQLINSTTLHFGRALAYTILNVYATKMAAVFMVSTATVALYTRFAPRWIALIGYSLAVILLLGSYFIPWGDMMFPGWVLLLSIPDSNCEFQVTNRSGSSWLNSTSRLRLGFAASARRGLLPRAASCRRRCGNRSGGPPARRNARPSRWRAYAASSMVRSGLLVRRRYEDR